MIEDGRLDLETAEREAIAVKQGAEAIAVETNTPVDSGTYDDLSMLIDNVEQVLNIDRELYIGVQNKLFDIGDLCGVSLAQKIVRLLYDKNGELLKAISPIAEVQPDLKTIIDSTVDQVLQGIREDNFQHEDKLRTVLREYLDLVCKMMLGKKS